MKESCWTMQENLNDSLSRM